MTTTRVIDGPGFQPKGNQIVSRKTLQRQADVDPRLTRSHYFDNRLLTDDDLNRDQLYLDGRLREVGQALGSGIVKGLEISFDALTGLIRVSPGLAVSGAGRILELSQALELDLGDRARLSELNQGKHRRLKRNLYAVVIQYAEFATDVAEVFPTDLAAKRTFNYDLTTEGVQLTLVELPGSLSNQNPIVIRANLMKAFAGDPSAAGAVPEDGVALGVLAISDDRPRWLDGELLRQPARAIPSLGDPQRDLFRQYQNIFSDLLAFRQAGSLSGDFAVEDYFSLIPPVGMLSKDALSPVEGRVGFFPEHYHVWIAPVRQAEVPLLIEESLSMPALDLTEKDAQEMVVLVPLSNSDYGHLAKRLERPADASSGTLATIDLLRLRLYPKRPVHQLDTDEATWQAIWDQAQPQDLLYIRRPRRAAETRVSGIVLAHGVQLPPVPPEAPEETPADGGLLLDEDSVLLNRLNLTRLTTVRRSTEEAGREAAALLISEFGDQALVAQQVNQLCLRTERRYDTLLWQTLLSLARDEQLSAFYTELVVGQDEDRSTGEVVADMGGSFGLDPALLARWSSLAEEES